MNIHGRTGRTGRTGSGAYDFGPGQPPCWKTTSYATVSGPQTTSAYARWGGSLCNHAPARVIVKNYRELPPNTHKPNIVVSLGARCAEARVWFRDNQLVGAGPGRSIREGAGLQLFDSRPNTVTLCQSGRGRGCKSGRIRVIAALHLLSALLTKELLSASGHFHFGECTVMT